MSLWLPAQPFEALTAGAVETFLAERHSESSVLEYKERASAKNLPEDIAAFANTHGGLVILGVPDQWEGDFNRLVDVDDDLSSLQDRLVDVLSPPWVPPILLISPSDRPSVGRSVRRIGHRSPLVRKVPFMNVDEVVQALLAEPFDVETARRMLPDKNGCTRGGQTGRGSQASLRSPTPMTRVWISSM